MAAVVKAAVVSRAAAQPMPAGDADAAETGDDQPLAPAQSAAGMEREAKAARDLARALAGVRREAAAARREVTEFGNACTKAQQQAAALGQEVAALAGKYGELAQNVAGLESKTVALRFSWIEEGTPPDLAALKHLDAQLRRGGSG
jgi:hypothetical protein